MQELLDLAKQNKSDIEIFKLTNKTTNVDVRQNKIESIDKTSETGISIRLIKDHKLGFAYTTDESKELLEDLFKEALANAKNSHEDSNILLPQPSSFEPIITYDRDISNLSIKDKIALALQIESSAYSRSPKIKITEKTTFSDTEIKVEIINSNGVNVSYNSNHCGGFCEVIAIEGAEQENGFGISFTTDYRKFNAEKIGFEAAEKALELLSARMIPSQKLELVLAPYIGTQILGAISTLFSSDSVQKGKSLFAGKIGQAVSSKIITLIDDGRMKNGISSSPVDDEGVPSQETILIENGILSNFLYNSYTAQKEQKRSTGNGRRSSYRSLPEVMPSNIYFKPGDSDKAPIISRVSKGLYVTRVMGMHTVNPISGDFSIGAAGIMIENSEKTYPVKGITIAGNLIDLLKSIEEIGADLRFFPLSANFGSPTLLVADIAVSG